MGLLDIFAPSWGGVLAVLSINSRVLEGLTCNLYLVYIYVKEQKSVCRSFKKNIAHLNNFQLQNHLSQKFLLDNIRTFNVYTYQDVNLLPASLWLYKYVYNPHASLQQKIISASERIPSLSRWFQTSRHSSTTTGLQCLPVGLTLFLGEHGVELREQY
jgi:hypothetical protein